MEELKWVVLDIGDVLFEIEIVVVGTMAAVSGNVLMLPEKILLVLK